MTRLIPHVLFMLLVSGTVACAQNAEMLRVDGRAARLDGKFDTAITKLQEASRAEPDNADIHVEIGLALTGVSRYSEAGAHFRRALDIAPSYIDARLGLARLEYFQGRLATARQMATELGKAEPDSGAPELLAEIDKADAAEQAVQQAAMKAAQDAADARATAQKAMAQAAQKPAPIRKIAKAAPRKKKAPVPRIDLAAYDITPASAPEPKRWRIDLDGSHSHLTGDRPSWKEASARIGYETRPGTAISGGVQFADRYSQDDTYFDVRIDHKFSASTSVYLQAGATPDADFLPEWSLGAGGAQRIIERNGWVASTVATVDGRVSEYTTGTVQTYSTGVEQYFMDGRMWLTFRWLHLIDGDGDYHNGYLVRGDVVFNDSLRIFAGYADAPESDQGLTFVSRSVFGGAVFALDERIDLKFSLAHEERVGLFDLNSLSMGLTYRF